MVRRLIRSTHEVEVNEAPSQIYKISEAVVEAMELAVEAAAKEEDVVEDVVALQR